MYVLRGRVTFLASLLGSPAQSLVTYRVAAAARADMMASLKSVLSMMILLLTAFVLGFVRALSLDGEFCNSTVVVVLLLTNSTVVLLLILQQLRIKHAWNPSAIAI